MRTSVPRRLRSDVPRLAVLELVQDHEAFPSPGASHDVRDDLLNRIAAHELCGIRVDNLRLVVTDANGRLMYAIEPDIEDYIRCGNPYNAGSIAAGRGSLRGIRSESIIAGKTRLQTVHATPQPLPKQVAAALDD
jgi:hypothetical protein